MVERAERARLNHYFIEKNNEEIEAVKHLYPNLKRNEIEAILICGEEINYEKRYEKYRRTKHWLFLRKNKLRQVGERCELCKSFEKIEVHHQKYRSLYDCQISDLQVLCQRCHVDAHRKEHTC